MTLKGKRLLVTGGTGSFGYKVATTLARTAGLDRVVIFSRDEKKQHDMQKRYPYFDFVLGDVRDLAALNSALKGVDVVFHAAALKQVPSCERNPVQAMKTNCLGAANLCIAAIAQDVEKVIALSTDKAVLPINAMGITKALAEKIFTSQYGPTIFCCVRYGNVLGTRGSVLPVWQKELEEGRPITITKAEATRFVMNLSDAVSLVGSALECGKQGEVLVLKAKATSVLELAEAVARVRGYSHRAFSTNHKLRPGEKLHETLVAYEELGRSADSGNYVTLSANHMAVESDFLPLTVLMETLKSDTAPRPAATELQGMIVEGFKDIEESL